ncbi:hypothetical protein LMG24076_01021 [Trinickia soli]|nr:hypothetical protein LMG24076_01021 [Trinickia soli]
MRVWRARNALVLLSPDSATVWVRLRGPARAAGPTSFPLQYGHFCAGAGASGAVASGAAASGAVASGAVASGAVASGAVASDIIAGH